MAKKIVKYTIIGIMVLMALALLRSSDVAQLLKVDLDAIRGAARENQMTILLIMLVLMIIQNMFTIIPLILLITANITLLGFFDGYLWSWLTSIVGGIVGFVGARFWFQKRVEKKLSPTWKDRMERNGFRYTFIGRIFPFVPTSLINIAAGISSVKMKPFVLGTILGNMIYFLFLALVSQGLMVVSLTNAVWMALAIGAAIAGYYIVWRKRRVREKTIEHNAKIINNGE